MKTIRVVAAIIYRNDDEFLIARKKQGISLAGLWEFPGGKIEENEEAKFALEREIKEELNINISSLIPFIDYTYYGENMILEMQSFKCFSADTITHLTDHDRVEWIKACDIDHYPLAPADLVIAEELKK
ncbi:MAG TPA: (deoxy)nucleoside triphosphate pyrophosphohydrolase [Bacteroidia bacterium]|nr:(deoxy)nucleoside triphosphate pyrophosphohydrolase [Bacteroidia bacterium]